MSKSRRVPAFAMAALLAGSLLLAGCANTSAPTSGTTSTPAVIRLGNLPTEDILPLWAAQQKGLFEQAGIKVEIVPFQSAQERDAAYTAGAIDGFMGDMIAVGTLNNGGFPTKVVTICLGATPAEGRFGVVAAPGSRILPSAYRLGVSTRVGEGEIESMKLLANVPVGTSLNTIQEYVLDGLFQEAGVPVSAVKTVTVPKVPVRFELLMANKLQAAALPEPFLSLAIKQGAPLVAADTTGTNLSQTVLAFSTKYLDSPAGGAAVGELLGVWDQGAALVNANRDSFRQLLVDKARLPQPIATSYEVNTYPKAQLPAQADVNPVLAWMQGKKLLTKPLTHADIMWQAGGAAPSSSTSTTP